MCARKVCRRMYGAVFKTLESLEYSDTGPFPTLTWEHIEEADAHKACRELENILKTSGGAGFIDHVKDRDFIVNGVRW